MPDPVAGAPSGPPKAADATPDPGDPGTWTDAEKQLLREALISFTRGIYQGPISSLNKMSSDALEDIGADD